MSLDPNKFTIDHIKEAARIRNWEIEETDTGIGFSTTPGVWYWFEFVQIAGQKCLSFSHRQSDFNGRVNKSVLTGLKTENMVIAALWPEKRMEF